jgi:hypothetical protein
MAIISIPGGLVLDKEGTKTVTLNKEELRDTFPELSESPYYSDLSTWEAVTLVYTSDFSNYGQVVNMVFDASEANPSIQVQIKDNFVSDTKITGIIVRDKAGGSVLIKRVSLMDTNDFDIEVEREIAPASEVLDSLGLDQAEIDPSEIADWKVGWVVRIWDDIVGQYLDQTNIIDSIDEMNNIINFQDEWVLAFDLVLLAPNNNKYKLYVSSNGELVTEITSDDITQPFRVLKKDTVDEYASFEVDNDGTLIVNNDPSNALPIVNLYGIVQDASSDIWIINFLEDDRPQLELSLATLTGKFIRFAFANEVSLEQLTKYRFNY